MVPAFESAVGGLTFRALGPSLLLTLALLLLL
jgi:hypothetical protein